MDRLIPTRSSEVQNTSGSRQQQFYSATVSSTEHIQEYANDTRKIYIDSVPEEPELLLVGADASKDFGQRKQPLYSLSDAKQMRSASDMRSAISQEDLMNQRLGKSVNETSINADESG